MIKRLIAFILTLLIVSSALFAGVNVLAANRKSVTFTFESYGFSTSLRAMEPKTDFAPGDTAYIAVSLSSIEAIGGFGVKLNYNPDYVSFDKSKIVYFIEDEDSEYLANDTGSAVILAWETTAENTSLEGTVMYIPFIIREDIGTTATSAFTAEIIEAFEGNKAQTTINTTIASTPTITVSATALDSAFISSVETLKNISYNPTGDTSKPADSLAAIKKALEDFNKLTNAQQQTFYRNYRELYDVLSNALNEYYKLAAAEASRLAEEEAQKFLNDNAKLLAKEAYDLTLKDKAAVEKLNNAYKVLSDKAKALISDTVKAKITAFNEKIEELQAAEDLKAEIAEFKNNYAMFLSDENYPAMLAGWEATYDSYMVYISEADLLYGLLSSEAQESLKDYKARIDELTALAEKYAAKDAEAAKNQEAATAFQNTYKKVFTLNRNNVSIEDKTAIEMVLEAYEALENEAVRELLSGRMNTLKTLLKVIEELQEVEKEETGEDGNQDGEKDDTSSEGSTSAEVKTEYVTETVTSVVTETKTEYITQTVTQTEPQTETQTVTNTATKIINKLQGASANFRTALCILLVFLMISICGLIVTVFISQKQLLTEVERGGDSDEIE